MLSCWTRKDVIRIMPCNVRGLWETKGLRQLLLIKNRLIKFFGGKYNSAKSGRLMAGNFPSGATTVADSGRGPETVTGHTIGIFGYL